MNRRVVVLLTVFLAVGCGRTEIYDPPPVPDVVLSEREVAIAPDGCQVVATETYPLEPFKRQPIDVLFVIDDSCSMENDQAALAREFDSFIGPFRANQVDFHLATVTTDMDDTMKRAGRFVTPFLTNTTPTLESAFSTMVNVGSEGSAIERALAGARAAVTEPLVSTTNKGFLRPEADLGLIILGDEDDQSNFTVPQFVDTLRGLKTGDQRVTVTSIVGLDSCLFPGLVRGWRLATVATTFKQDGNLVLCRTDYANVLRTTAGRLVNQRCIVGLRRPIDQSRRVRVTVNGEPSTFRSTGPDDNYPQGSIELDVCPSGGGTVAIGYDECWR